MSRIALFFWISLACFIFFACGTEDPPPEITLHYHDNLSLEYDEVVEAYHALAAHYPQAKLMEMGSTDVGKPLHLFMISSDEDFDPSSIQAKGKSIVLINNGIHAGEPAGIDASVKFAKTLLDEDAEIHQILDNAVIAIIPVYNIGGLLHLSRYHRMNQDGPIYKGARRNARNLDLNRDFAKQDSQNARSFAKIFHFLNPDVFIDTHTTNGVQHKEVMTLIPTLHNRLHGDLGDFFKQEMTPALYERMNEETPWGAIPYLHRPGFGDIRDGIAAFNDHPYYSSGYAALFNTLGYITETQYAKPYPERVKATFDFIAFTAEFTADHSVTIRELRQAAAKATAQERSFILDWQLDTDTQDSILFHGYATKEETTPLTDRTTTTYLRDEPRQQHIPLFDTYQPALQRKAPEAYIIPQAWKEVIDRLVINGVEVTHLEHDTILDVETTYIRDYEASPQSNQGRQLITIHDKEIVSGPRQFYAGDALVHTDQLANNYIVHMLEPLAPASFLRWGFFNAALEDGEGWWIYAFEDYAWQRLQEDEALREAFDQRMKDADFAGDPRTQLEFILSYITRDQTETGWQLYPVARLAQ